MEMTQFSLEEFTKQLASKTPVPGGGGASAYVGSIAISLGDMVGEYTVGKKKYADVEEAMYEWMERAQNLRERLLACIQKDAVAFEPLSKAYAKSKDDPDYDEVMERCLQDAAAVPMEILTLCCETTDLLDEFANHGSVLMISDAACGAAMCKAAILSAAVNIRINTKSMKNREYAEEMNHKTDEMVTSFTRKCDLVFESVYAKL